MTVTLLIADDNARVREGLRRLLAGGGIDVLEAATCQQAIRLARRPDVDVVMLDVNMPDGNGFDALARIKHDCPDLPVVMHSEHNRPSYASRAHARGAAAYLVKGLDKDDLLKAISAAVCSANACTEAQPQSIKNATCSTPARRKTI